MSMSIPERITSEEQKNTEDYTVSWGEFLHNYHNSTEYDGSQTYINSKRIEFFKELRAYGDGRQDINRYLDNFTFEREGSSRERKGLANIDYSIMPVAPKLINAVVSMTQKKSTDTNVVFMDDLSSEEKEDKKAEMWMMKEEGQFLNQMNQVRGIPSKKQNFIPEDSQELEMYAEVGGIKLQKEIAYETALNNIYSKDLRWIHGFEPEIVKDYLTVGFCGTKPYIDPLTHKIKNRRLKAENVIIEHSSHRDYRTSEFFGEYIPQSLNTVFKAYTETTGNKISEEQWKKIMETYQTSFDNNGLNIVDYNDYYERDWFDSPNNNSEFFSSYRVKVLDFVYLATDVVDNPDVDEIKHYIEPSKVRKAEVEKGKVKKDFDGRYYKIKKVKKDKLNIRRWRRGKWVVGTDIAYDYGVAYDQVRDEYNEPIAPFNCIRVPDTSLVEKIKPFIDAIQLSWMTIQRLKSTAQGYGIDVNMEALENVTLGGQKYNPADLLKLGRLNNIFIYRDRSATNINKVSTRHPITEREGGMGRFFLECIQDIEMNQKMIQDNTGLNEVIMASNPNPNATMGQAEMAAGAAMTVIDHVFRDYKDIKERDVYVTLLLLNVIAASSDLSETSPYRTMLGKHTWEQIQKYAKQDIRKLAIKIAETPSQQEYMEINQMINISLQGGKNGNAALTPDEAFLLKTMIRDGKSPKLIALLLRSLRRQREKENEESQMRLMNQNAKNAQEQQAQKLQGEMAKDNNKEKADFQAKQALTTLEKDLEARNDRLSKLQDISQGVIDKNK